MKIESWLKQQKELLEAATPGPMELLRTSEGICIQTIGGAKALVAICNSQRLSDNQNENNAQFIASVRTEHARALLLIEKLREALSEAIDELSQYAQGRRKDTGGIGWEVIKPKKPSDYHFYPNHIDETYIAELREKLNYFPEEIEK